MASKSGVNMALRDYHNWIISLVDSEDHYLAREYSQLMGFLDDYSFKWVLKLDEDRAKDGIQLRKEYDFEYSRGDISIYDELFDVPCSVLEMLVALSLRCYDEFLSGFDVKKVTPHKVFLHILTSLDLFSETNNRFSYEKCVKNVKSFIEKLHVNGRYLTVFKIDPKVANPHKMELWWQMQRYIDSYFDY